MSNLSLFLWLRKRRHKLLHRLIGGRKWERLFWRRYGEAKAPVKVRLHGFDVLLNPGNTYPRILAETPWFNAPLVELVNQVFRAGGSPVTFVDIGSATGDTVLLLKQKCPGQVGEFICVEGDGEFFKLLSHNLAQFHDVRLEPAILSDRPAQIRSLVKHHGGSAMAQGDDLVTARPLDQLAERWAHPADVLKLDVDGSDGRVLAGAKQILSRDRPAVIFEWHPQLIVKCGNDVGEAFSVLQSAGYNRFLWFNNNGTFSHFSEAVTPAHLRKAADYLLAVNYRADEHFDVIALHETARVDEVALAAAEHFRKK